MRHSQIDSKSSFVEWMRNGPQDRLPLPHRDDPSLISFVFQLLILSYGAYRIAYRLCMYYIPSRHYLGMFVANASKKSPNECYKLQVTSRHQQRARKACPCELANILEAYHSLSLIDQPPRKLFLIPKIVGVLLLKVLFRAYLIEIKLMPIPFISYFE